jgi:hypothetical protein
MDHFDNRGWKDPVGVMLAVNSGGRQGGFTLRTQVALPGFPYLGRNSDPLSACPPGARLC